MARTKIRNRSYKNATNTQAENSPEGENSRVEPAVQEVQVASPSLEDEYIPVPLNRSPPRSERPPDPPLNEELSCSSEEDASDTLSPAVIASIRAANAHSFRPSDPASTVSPGSPVNLSRYSPIPGCSWDINPVRRTRPIISRFVDEDTCDVPSTSYPRSPGPNLAIPGCSRDSYPRPTTSTSFADHFYMSPSSPVNLSLNSPIFGGSQDSLFESRPSTSTAVSDEISRMSPSPPLGQNVWDTIKESCKRRVYAAANRPSTPENPPVPVDDIFSPNTQKEIRSSIRNLFPNGPPPLPPVKPMKRPKKGDVPYIVGCTRRPRVPSPTCLTVFKGDDYGITSETNCDEEECTPAKRARRTCVANLSKSRFNAESDSIATRLLLNDKINTLLGRNELLKTGEPSRIFSPLPSTSSDRETIMINEKQFGERLSEDFDLEDDDELPEIVWGTTSKNEENKRSHNVTPINMNENIHTEEDSQSGDTVPLIINEDADNNNENSMEYDEIQFDKCIPKEKLIVSSDAEQVSVNPEVDDVKASKPTFSVLASNEVICIDDYKSISPNKCPNEGNGDVILLNPETAQAFIPVQTEITKMPIPIPITESDLVIEVPEATATTSQSTASNNEYQEVQFISETRSDESSSATDTDTRENIFDVQIISCDRNRPRSYELLTELQSWFSIMSDSCGSQRAWSSSSTRSKRRLKEPPSCESTVNTQSPPENPTGQPAPTSEPTNEKKLGECPICLESLSANSLASTNCGHVFCLDCIRRSLSTSGKRCPTCRKQLKGVGYHQVFL